MWTPEDYFEALQALKSETDPEVKRELQAEVRKYQAMNPQVGAPTGLSAIETAFGEAPQTREQRDFDPTKEARAKVVAGDFPKQAAKPYKVGKATVPGLWHEPSLERFKRDLAPVYGSQVEDLDEHSELYKEYANRLWNMASAEAEQKGESLTRASQIPSFGGKLVAQARDLADTALLGLDETATAGAGNLAATGALEATGLDPDASAKAEEALARNPTTRTIANLAGYLNPFAPAMLGGRAAISVLGPKLGALAAKAGGGTLARGAAKLGTAAAGGAAALATEGAAQELLPKTPGELLETDPETFLRHRAEEAKLGALAGPAAEVGGALAGKGAQKLSERTARRASPATAGLSESDLARIGMLTIGGWKIPLAMGAANRSGPLLEGISKLQATRAGAPAAGEWESPAMRAVRQQYGGAAPAPRVNPFMPGFPGGAVASPLLQEQPGMPADQGDAEIIRRAIEEATKAPAAPQETKPEPMRAPAGYRFKGQTEPIGFFSDMHEGVMGLSDMQQELFGKAPPRPPAASYKQDPEFMALLAKIPSVTKDPGEARDQAAGYIANYPLWRKLTNEARAAGEEEPDFSRAYIQRFNAQGFNRTPRGDELAGEVGVYSDLPVPANKQIGEWDDVRSEQSQLPTAGDRAAFDKSLPKNADTEKIVKTMATRLQAGATVPSPNLVYEALQQVGYNVPLADVKRMLRGYQETML